MLNTIFKRTARCLCLLGLIFLFIFLSACGRQDTRQLQQSLDELKKKIDISSQNTNKISIPQPLVATYKKTLRSPFEESTFSTSQTVSTNPLNAFSLDNLRLVGTIDEGNRMRGVIMTPDKKIYQVEIGDVIGNQYGKIVKIYRNGIDINEPTSTDKKHLTQRIVSLPLKE